MTVFIFGCQMPENSDDHSIENLKLPEKSLQFSFFSVNWFALTKCLHMHKTLCGTFVGIIHRIFWWVQSGLALTEKPFTCIEFLDETYKIGICIPQFYIRLFFTKKQAFS